MRFFFFYKAHLHIPLVSFSFILLLFSFLHPPKILPLFRAYFISSIASSSDQRNSNSYGFLPLVATIGHVSLTLHLKISIK